MRKIAVIYGGHAPHYRTFHEPKFAHYIDKLIYLPEFEETDLTPFDVLIVPSQLNSKLLLKAAPKIHEFANSGKVVLVLGPQPWDWLPNQNWEHRPTNFWWWLEENADSGLRVKNEDHPFHQHFTLESCTWHQHGVFWPPAHATTLIATADNGSVLYIDEESSKGTWIITTLDPDYHFGSYFMPATEYFLESLFPWLSTGKITK
ncbi:MAG: hypothetical protein J6F30_04850 [Cellulosilyticum sp.]|nr:hypothetical protein [Cellulosilyticum sp.]